MRRPLGKNWNFVKTINLDNLGLITIKEDKKMLENEEVEKWTLEDGRRAEKITTENKSGDEVERVTEIRIDDERPKNVQQKIVEKIKPVIYERVSESLDVKTGEIIGKKVENIDLKLKEKSETSFVTREEMVEAIVAAVKSIKSSSCRKVCGGSSNQDNSDSQATTELKSLGLASEIETSSKTVSVKDYILLAVIAIQVVGLIYLIFKA
jgi:hypothetical protein